MKINILIVFYVFITIFFLSAQSVSFNFNTGDNEFDSFLNEINIEAKADLASFSAELSISFEISVDEIDELINVEQMEPAEIYLALEISEESDTTLEKVIEIYKKNKPKGWGYIAKQMGIKPGSKAFKKLKEKSENKSKNVNKSKGKKKGKSKKKK